ncbi:MAG: hypothetical protein GC179_04790 [Anaerolineaceae bacterium]|nr:hypothetical protein [Anaerolineaceae bacterium]
MFLKTSPLALSIKRSTLLAAAPIFFLVLLALWTFVNSSVYSTDSKRIANGVYEVVKQVQPQPNADTSPNGAILSRIENYGDPELDGSDRLRVEDRCFLVNEDIQPTLPERSQWN